MYIQLHIQFVKNYTIKRGGFVMRILEYIVPEEFSDRPVLHFLKGHLKLSTKNY